MKSKLLRKIMKTKGNKKKSLVEEAIISLLNDHDAYSDEIYNLAEELDISKSTLKRARAELTSEGTIKPKRTGSNKGNDKQRTIFSLVKKYKYRGSKNTVTNKMILCILKIFKKVTQSSDYCISKQRNTDHNHTKYRNHEQER